MEKEDNLPDGWKEFDGDQPTPRKRKRGNDDSPGEGESNHIKKVRCEGSCPSEQNKTTKSKNIQTNKPGLSCFQMEIDAFPETKKDKNKSKNPVSVAGRVTAKKRWGKLKSGLYGWRYERVNKKKETPAIRNLTPSKVRGGGDSQDQDFGLRSVGKFARPNIAETMDA